jgi:hypothetical protein
VSQAADWLRLAAGPVFAGMGLVALLGGGPSDAFCGSVPTSPLDGMAMMYLLMAAVHAAPWLQRADRGRG